MPKWVKAKVVKEMEGGFGKSHFPVGKEVYCVGTEAWVYVLGLDGKQINILYKTSAAEHLEYVKKDGNYILAKDHMKMFNLFESEWNRRMQ